jgi:hypothetical protein
MDNSGELFPTESQLLNPVPHGLYGHEAALFTDEEKLKAQNFIKEHDIEPGKTFMINISAMQIPRVGIYQHEYRENPIMREVTILSKPIVLTKDDPLVKKVPKRFPPEQVRHYQCVVKVKFKQYGSDEEEEHELYTKEFLNRIYLHEEGRDSDIYTAWGTTDRTSYSKVRENRKDIQEG